MRHNSLHLDVPTTAIAGLSKQVRDMREKYVQFGGTFVASFTIEISLDGGTNWVSKAAGVSAPGLYAIPEPATHLRIRTTAYTSGTPAVVVAGFDDNG